MDFSVPSMHVKISIFVNHGVLDFPATIGCARHVILPLKNYLHKYVLRSCYRRLQAWPFKAWQLSPPGDIFGNAGTPLSGKIRNKKNKIIKYLGVKERRTKRGLIYIMQVGFSNVLYSHLKHKHLLTSFVERKCRASGEQTRARSYMSLLDHAKVVILVVTREVRPKQKKRKEKKRVGEKFHRGRKGRGMTSC